VRKITISLPEDLVAFADRRAERQQVSRSRFIADALAHLEAAEAEQEAAEGYRYYAGEATEFAAASARAVAEAISDAT